jgi:RNA recognition motif-containing protein
MCFTGLLNIRGLIPPKLYSMASTPYSYQMTERDLKVEFEKFGKVSKASIVKDKLNGKSKGFGFVEMPDMAEAAIAIKKLDGVSIKGRNLKVNEARPRDNDGPPRQTRRD